MFIYAVRWIKDEKSNALSLTLLENTKEYFGIQANKKKSKGLAKSNAKNGRFSFSESKFQVF